MSVHHSVCPHLGGGRHPPARSSQGGTPARGVPLPGGYPTLGTPLSDLAGGVPLPGVPHHGYPLSDLAGGGGTAAGGYPILTWLGGIPARGVPLLEGGYPTSGRVLDTPWSVCLLHSRRRTFLFGYSLVLFYQK